MPLSELSDCMYYLQPAVDAYIERLQQDGERHRELDELVERVADLQAEGHPVYRALCQLGLVDAVSEAAQRAVMMGDSFSAFPIFNEACRFLNSQLLEKLFDRRGLRTPSSTPAVMSFVGGWMSTSREIGWGNDAA